MMILISSGVILTPRESMQLRRSCSLTFPDLSKEYIHRRRGRVRSPTSIPVQEHLPNDAEGRAPFVPHGRPDAVLDGGDELGDGLREVLALLLLKLSVELIAIVILSPSTNS